METWLDRGRSPHDGGRQPNDGKRFRRRVDLNLRGTWEIEVDNDRSQESLHQSVDAESYNSR